MSAPHFARRPRRRTEAASIDELPAQRRRSTLVALLRNPRSLLSLLWISLVLVCAVGAPVLAPADPLAQNLSRALEAPSSEHLLGTDALGRDLLSRIMYGGGDALLGIAVALGVALAIGVVAGVAAGYWQGAGAFVADRVFDSLLAIPGIVIMLMVVAIFGQDLLPAEIALGVLLSSQFYRLAVAGTRAVRGRDFVDAARVAGIPHVLIVVRHVVPNMIRPIIVQASLAAAMVMIMVSGLSFLGLGPPPPDPQWGLLIQEASTKIRTSPWLMVPTGAAIIFTAFAFTTLGDVLAEAATPLSAKASTLGPRPTRRRTADGTEAGSNGPLLAVEGLTVAFPAEAGTVDVIRGVRLSVEPGRTVALVGESGCGKTITALAIAGLLTSDATVRFDQLTVAGVDLRDADESTWQRLRGGGVAYIPQEPMMALDPAFTVGSQLTAPLRRGGLARGAARAEAAKLLTRVGIVDPDAVLRSHPHELSGGMAQRVCIALALTGRPRLLVADEPTTALDVTVQAEILDLLRSLQVETGVGIVLVTHDWGVVADIADEVAVMYAGQVVEQADAATVFSSPRHPYTAMLQRSAPRPEHAGGELPTIPGVVPSPGRWPQGCHFQNRCPIVDAGCRQAPVPLEPVGPEHTARCLRSAMTTEVAARG